MTWKRIVERYCGRICGDTCIAQKKTDTGLRLGEQRSGNCEDGTWSGWNSDERITGMKMKGKEAGGQSVRMGNVSREI